jgi:MoxR-like ATPase
MARPTLTAVASPAAVATATAPVAGLAALCDALDGTFQERHSVIRAVARAILAGENVFILGEPGTGKSALVRAFCHALSLSYFEHLMGRYTTPEQLFGPFSIPELQKGRFTREGRGYMQAAQIVFLDEVWKSNPGVLNSLLSISNEHLFHDDGKALPCPLVSLVTASNELPESESELAAIYDRCGVRLTVDPIRDRAAFRALVAGKVAGKKLAPPPVQIDFAAEQAACRAVVFPDDVIDALVTLRFKVEAEGFKVSDRKWVQITGLLQAAAHLEGRTTVETDDLEVLEDVLWREPAEKTKITKLIQQVSNPMGAKAVADLDAAVSLRASLPVIDDKDATTTTAFLNKARGVNKDLRDIATRMATYGSSRKVAECLVKVEAIRKEVATLSARASGLEV